MRLPAKLTIVVWTAALAGCSDLTTPESRPDLKVAPQYQYTPPGGPYDHTFWVNNTGDAGSGTLRQAILDANATVGTRLIAFAIPGDGPHVINVLDKWPQMRGGVTVDGYTQPGAKPNILGPGEGTDAVIKIEVRGKPASVDRWELVGAGAVIRGLSITNWLSAGVHLGELGGHRLEGNFIGVGPDGVTPRGNIGWDWWSGGVMVQSPNNVIGGLDPAARNLISGNRTAGIQLLGSSNVIQGNLIGTDRTGTVGVPNHQGVSLQSRGGDVPFGNLIGGTVPQARNVISGNNTGPGVGEGIGMFGGGAVNTGTVIQGNYIGPDVTGTLVLGDQPNGVRAYGAGGSHIGGLEPGARNVISGNSWAGIQITGFADVIEGNFIGVDVTGKVALGNRAHGIETTGPDYRIVGNVVSATQEGPGVGLRGGHRTVIQGNKIGTDVDGILDLGNAQRGVVVSASGNVRIGGTGPDEGNVISGNGLDGIWVEWEESSGGLVQGNRIGVGSDGAPMGNGSNGFLLWRSNGWLIGGLDPAAANVIAHNGIHGVALDGGAWNSDDAVLGNSIFANGALGIRLMNGVNRAQNFPVIASAESGGSGTTVSGTLTSNPSTTYRLEFFANAVGDPSGFGEGETFLGSREVTTDGSGEASFTVTFPVTVPAAHVVTATASAPATAVWPWSDVTTYSQTSQFSGHLVVTEANHAPAVTSPADQSSTETDAVSLSVSANDPDGDALTWSATGLPAGLSIDASTGVISGTIPEGAAGSYTVTVTASDGFLAASTTFAWTVEKLNHAPSAGPVADQTNIEADAVTLSVAGSDPDGDALTWSATGLPAGLSIHPSTGVISGTIPEGAAGSYTVTVTASDGSLSASTTFAWTVLHLNHAPSAGPVADQTHTEADAVTLSVPGSDSDGDALTWSATGLPAGLSIDASTGVISGTIPEGAAGSYTVTVTASDGSLSASTTFAWTVLHLNHAPTVGSVADQSNTEADAVTLTVPGSDPDEDALTWSATGLPEGLSINPSTGEISGTIPEGAAGSYTVTVTASDGSLTSSATFTWTVAAAPPPPPPGMAVGKVTGGSIRTPDKGRGGFNIQSDGTTLKGQLEFQNAAVNLHVSTWLTLEISADRTKAWFTGLGEAGELIEVYVEDNGEPGTRDVFRIARNGVQLNGDGKIAGGNIQIHK